MSSLYIPEDILNIIWDYYYQSIHKDNIENIIHEMNSCFNPLNMIRSNYLYLDNNFIDRYRKKQQAYIFPSYLGHIEVFNHLDIVKRIKDSFNAIQYNKYLNQGGNYSYTFWCSNIK